jgi:hypothetical protein
MRLLTAVLLTAIISMLFLTGCPKPAETDTTGTPSGQTNTQTPPQDQGMPEGTSSNSDASGLTSTSPTGTAAPVETVGQELPTQWPAFIPIMDGFTTGTSSLIEKPVLIINLGITGTPSIDEATAFYTNLEGWTKNEPLPWVVEGPERQFNLKHGDHDFLGVTIREKEGKTNILFVYNNDTPQQ